MSKINQQTMAGRVVPISNGPLKAETIIRQIYCQQQHGEEECSLEYSDVDQDTAYEVIEELDENNEARVHRYCWNSLLKTLSIFVLPSSIHQCFTGWFMFRVAVDMCLEKNFPSLEDWSRLGFMSSPNASSFVAPYEGSKKEPDCVVWPFGPTRLPTPTIVVESGWSETREKLHEDMRVWLIGGRPHVQMVIVVKWTRTSDERVTGDVEVFECDENDYPRSVQKEIIFPEPPSAVAEQHVITITKRQLWGQNLPAGQNPDDRYNLLVKDLRREGRSCITEMGLNPA